MSVRRALGMIAIAIFSAAAGSAVRADILFSDMTADPFNTGHGWGIIGDPSNVNGWASNFTVGQPALATQIDVVVDIWKQPVEQHVNVALYDTGPLGTPGALLSGPYVVDVPVTAVTPESVSLSAPVSLTDGQTYWVAVLPGESTTSAGWVQNPAFAGGTAGSPDGTKWSKMPWFDYNGEFDVVGAPEPSAMAGLFFAAAGSF